MYVNLRAVLFINFLIASCGSNVFAEHSEKNGNKTIISEGPKIAIVATNKSNFNFEPSSGSIKSHQSSMNGSIKAALLNLNRNTTRPRFVVSDFLPHGKPSLLMMKGCAQRSRVRAICLDIGRRSKDSRLVLKKSVKAEAKENGIVKKYVAYSVPQKWVRKGYVISHIKVTNKMELGTEALVSVIKGGLLDNQVDLVLESQKGRGMNVHVQIYMSFATMAYKSQLSSLISYIKTL